MNTPNRSGADRVLFGMAALGCLTLIGFLAWSAGITPASHDEREFISMLGRSAFSDEPRVKAVVAVADEASYVARHHFFAAEEAFNAVQSEITRPAK